MCEVPVENVSVNFGSKARDSGSQHVFQHCALNSGFTFWQGIEWWLEKCLHIDLQHIQVLQVWPLGSESNKAKVIRLESNFSLQCAWSAFGLHVIFLSGKRCETPLQREIQAPLPHLCRCHEQRGTRGLYTGLQWTLGSNTFSPDWRQLSGGNFHTFLKNFVFFH